MPGRSGPRRILADVSRAAPAGEPAENPPEPEPEPDDGLEGVDDLEDPDDLEDEEPGRRRLTRRDGEAVTGYVFRPPYAAPESRAGRPPPAPH